LLLLATSGVTLLYQAATARNYITYLDWWPWMVGLAAAGAVILLATARRKPGWLSAAGFICLAAALLVTPAAWSALTTLHPSSSLLPSAYSGETTRPKNPASLEEINVSMLTYLQAHTQDVAYLMAVPNAMAGADYVIATSRPVLYIGGFNGSDPVVTPDDLTQLVSLGKLRYILWANYANGMETNSSISTWIASNCGLVQGYSNILYMCGE
jgi:hypothetical protein